MEIPFSGKMPTKARSCSLWSGFKTRARRERDWGTRLAETRFSGKLESPNARNPENLKPRNPESATARADPIVPNRLPVTCGIHSAEGAALFPERLGDISRNRGTPKSRNSVIPRSGNSEIRIIDRAFLYRRQRIAGFVALNAHPQGPHLRTVM